MEEKLDIELLKILGKLTHEIRVEVSKMPKIGMGISKIINFVEDKIFERGYLPAFPCTVSINEMAAHYTVFDEDIILKKGDLIKIDFGISHNGFITDNAVSVEVEDNKYEKLMRANLDGLNAVMEKIELGTSMGEVGKIVNDVAIKNGFKTIHNLSGHQIAKNNLHCGLSVPNCNNLDPKIVKDNMELAVEPFFTMGEPKVKAAGNSNILHLMKDKVVRDPIAKKVLIYIKENFPKLPFSKRWLLDSIADDLKSYKNPSKFSKSRILYALRILKSQNIIYEYEALATVDGSIVSQYEDAVVFLDGKKTIITRL